MRTFVHRVSSIAILLAVVSFGAPPARGAWVPQGNPVCTAPGDQTRPLLAPDGSGGAFVAWFDQRRGFPTTDLYATRLLADGSVAPGWPANGAVISATGTVTTGTPYTHSVVADGAGGLMVFWFDFSTYQPRMQHVDGSGGLAPGFPADGMILPITVGGPSGRIVRAVSDGAGGAYFLWNNFDGFRDVFYLTRLTGSGGFAAGWNASGVAQASSDSFSPFLGFSSVRLLADSDGGALVAATWSIEDFPSGSHSVGLVRRTRPDGTASHGGGLSGPSAGAPVGLAYESGSLFYAWAVSGATPERRMQRLASDNSAQWPNPTAAPVSDEVLTDGSGGAYLFGRPHGFDRLELHRCKSDGSSLETWPNGIDVSTTGSYYSFAAVRSGDQVYMCWSTSMPVAADLRALAVTSDGLIAPGWHAGGTVVSDAAGTQVMTSMIPIGLENALVAWEDFRAGNQDVYVTLLEPTGPVTVDAPAGSGASSLAFAGRSAWPNPARATVRFEFTLPEEGEASLELVDLSGRVLSRLQAEPRDGVQSLSFDTSRLPAGLYWARLRQGEAFAVTRFSVLR